MSELSKFSPDAQRYLDGDPGVRLEGTERASADRLEQVVAAYAAQLRAPGAELDREVMRRIQEEPVSSRSWWSWSVTPHAVRVRPVVLALAAAAALIVVWRGGGLEAPVRATAPTVL